METEEGQFVTNALEDWPIIAEREASVLLADGRMMRSIRLLLWHQLNEQSERLTLCFLSIY